MADDGPGEGFKFKKNRLQTKKISVKVLEFTSIAFTGHAREQMEIRDITEDEVMETIRNPTETGLPTQPNRKRVRRNKSTKWAIDVVYEEEGSMLRIVTAFKKERRLIERRKKP